MSEYSQILLTNGGHCHFLFMTAHPNYALKNSKIKLPCRRALQFYALKLVGLLDVKRARPQGQQIALKNVDGLRPICPCRLQLVNGHV